MLIFEIILSNVRFSTELMALGGGKLLNLHLRDIRRGEITK
jgi:hypothetical protein